MMPRLLRSLLLLGAAALLVLGCNRGKVLEVNGFKIYEKHWNKTMQELGPQASFAFGCPEHMLTYTLLARRGLPSEVGVEGCGKKAVYIHPTEHSMVWVQQGDQAAIATAAAEEEEREQAASAAAHRTRP